MECQVSLLGVITTPTGARYQEREIAFHGQLEIQELALAFDSKLEKSNVVPSLMAMSPTTTLKPIERKGAISRSISNDKRVRFVAT